MNPPSVRTLFAAFLAVAALPSAAQTTAPPPSPDEPPPESLLLPPPGPPRATPPSPGEAGGPSRSFSVNLLKRLVERGALTARDAEDLMALAEADTAAAAAPASPAVPPLAPDEVQVTHVPEIVRNRIRDEVRDQLREEAKTEGWYAEAGDRASWPDRVEPFADIRIRYQVDTYPAGNDSTGAFPNFNFINTGDPFDIAGSQFSPQFNVDQERQRARLRFRLGAEMDIEDRFAIGFRLATGQDNSPVSANQSLGWAGDGQGGNFSKYAIWLDRAFLAWEPDETFRFLLGRFDNPFFSTSTIWSEDIGFDGVAAQWTPRGTDSVRPFVTAGAFPVFNTQLNFSSIQPAKFESQDKWLLAAQAGLDVKFRKDLRARAAAGYYHFHNIEGRLSDPFVPLTPEDDGSTDATRPAFAQKGNTYRPIRNILPTEANGFGTRMQYQYFGLASPFEVLTATGRLDYDGFEPVRLSLNGEWAKNLAFDRAAVDAVAVNNRGPVPPGGTRGTFDGSDTAWMVQLVAGDPALERKGRWNAHVTYRWTGSDAVVDGFNEQFFGGGGTNVKGWAVGVGYALTPRVRLGAEWSSADQITGPAFRNDILFFDFAASF